MKFNSRKRAGDGAVSQSPAVSKGDRRKPSFQDHIGQELRAMYDEVLQQPIPDRFIELLKALDEKADKP
ncbi:MAG: NepR family anti-sigma factor [Hyphomicrobiales bacterium]